VEWPNGIDTDAHIAAMKATGRTIAVLGGGFNKISPIENVGLFNEIIEAGGLAISEYEPDEEADTKNFPIRNRIISGLSLGVLVVEAGYRSGASLTAGIAMKQKKKVFCIPCNIDGKNHETNELILKGARPISTIDEIIKDCNIKVEKMNVIEIDNPVRHEIKKEINIQPEYKEIYETLSSGQKNIDEIFKQVKSNISKITANLTMMEIEGLIEELPGKMFRIL